MGVTSEEVRAAAEGSLSRVVLDYSVTMKRLVDEAKSPGFSVDSWGPLAAYVAVDDFVRVGAFKEVVSWQQYIAILTQWAVTAEWDCTFKRITEAPGRVYLELEERSGSGEGMDVVNSMSVYEFNAAGKLVHLDIYLQRVMTHTDTSGWDSAGD
jgi:hypothetical protein